MTPWPLSVAFPLTLLGSVVLILAFDVLAALYARTRPAFRHGTLWPLQFGLYVVIGFVAMLALLDLRRVEVVGAVTGFIEMTAGWAIVWRLGQARIAETTPLNIAVAVFSMTAFGFGLAIVGALAFNLVAGAMLRAHH